MEYIKNVKKCQEYPGNRNIKKQVDDDTRQSVSHWRYHTLWTSVKFEESASEFTLSRDRFTAQLCEKLWL